MSVYNVLILEDDLDRVSSFKECFNSNKSDNVFNVTFVDNADECIELLKNNTYSLVFLDHDLGGEIFVDTDYDNTGSAVARYWSENNHPSKHTRALVVIHSYNPTGCKYMNERIDGSVIVNSVWLPEVFNKHINFN